MTQRFTSSLRMHTHILHIHSLSLARSHTHLNETLEAHVPKAMHTKITHASAVCSCQELEQKRTLMCTNKRIRQFPAQVPRPRASSRPL